MLLDLNGERLVVSVEVGIRAEHVPTCLERH
jgi:hypothetical protein